MAATAHGQLMKLFCKTLKIFNQTSREPMLLPHTVQLNGGKPVLWIYPLDFEHAKQVDDSLLKIKTVLCRFVVFEPTRPPVNKLSDMAPYENIYDAIDQEKERDKENFKVERQKEVQRKLKEEKAIQRRKKRMHSQDKLDASATSTNHQEPRSPPYAKMLKFEIEKPKVDYSKRFLLRFVFHGVPADEAAQSRSAFRIKGGKSQKSSNPPQSSAYYVNASHLSCTTKQTFK